MRLLDAHGLPGGQKAEHKDHGQRGKGGLERDPQRPVVDGGEERPQALPPGGYLLDHDGARGHQVAVVHAHDALFVRGAVGAVHHQVQAAVDVDVALHRGAVELHRVLSHGVGHRDVQVGDERTAARGPRIKLAHHGHKGVGVRGVVGLEAHLIGHRLRDHHEHVRLGGEHGEGLGVVEREHIAIGALVRALVAALKTVDADALGVVNQRALGNLLVLAHGRGRTVATCGRDGQREQRKRHGKGDEGEEAQSPLTPVVLSHRDE